MHGESTSVDITSENIQNELRKIEELLGPYDPVDIMNFDETGVTGEEPQEMKNGEHPTINVNNISQKEQVNIAGVNNIIMSQPQGILSQPSTLFADPPINISNHERTHFVENIIPSLLALGKTFDFIEFKWCESEFISSQMLNQKDCDYDLRSAPGKYIDALGTLTTHNNMELIIVEASSGQLKENTIHSIEDTLKILKCGMSLLRKEVAHYNGASLSTFMKLKLYGVHVIKSQVTLS
ncbi:hypothetical protein G6F43_010690 [Rhizopus delemar]|nr:hypothetical protein G6F43_010690 [Rhizopus delemar]